MTFKKGTRRLLRLSRIFIRRARGRFLNPNILIRVFAVLMFGALWGTTAFLISSERDSAENAAIATSRRLAETYEAQVVRAVREIEQIMKFVEYAYEFRKEDVLAGLQAKDLLPPDLWFEVSIANRDGIVISSTLMPIERNVSEQDFFKSQIHDDKLFVSPARQDSSREWKIHFSRRLSDTGNFAGIQLISVHSSYFVAGYDAAFLGKKGLLGLTGTDGRLRARRSGEIVSAGDSIDYANIVAGADESGATSALSISPLDGIERYTTVRQLYGFPLAVIVGLSATEQMSSTENTISAYLWRASAASLLLIIVMVVLDRMSRQLAISRARVAVEQQQHAERIEHLAYHDGLTGLPNRSFFSKLIRQALHHASRHKRKMVLMFLDIDGFKKINDTLGHETGDELLKEVARRLSACVRASDSVFRLGGDEFVVLLPECGEKADAETVARKMLAAVARPFDMLGENQRVTTSVGISMYPEDGQDEQTLTKNADTAMYLAKTNGKNNFQFYSNILNTL